MTDVSATCDLDLLRRSLEDRLDDAAEERLAEHLAGCEGCRAELERLAGSAQDWSSVRESLRRETASTVAADSESETDFAVDFLEPSSSPDLLGRLGDIEIHEVIGRGGMGIVLKGFQQELKRLVAVKVLGPRGSGLRGRRRPWRRSCIPT